MRKALNLLLAAFIMLNIANCEALEGLIPKLIKDEKDMNASTPSGWKFLFGLDLNEKFADLLFKADDASLKVPGISSLGDKIPSAAMVVGKETKYAGKTYLEFAFMVKLDGDTLKTLKQKGFPQPSGDGVYGFYFANPAPGFVNGSAKDCSNKGVSDLVVTSKGFISFTNSSGAYAIPAKSGAAVSIAITDKDCGGSNKPGTAVVGGPVPPPVSETGGEPETNPKADEPPPGETAAPEPTTEQAQCSGDDAVRTDMGDAPAPSPRGEPEEDKTCADIGNFTDPNCKWKVGAVRENAVVNGGSTVEGIDEGNHPSEFGSGDALANNASFALTDDITSAGHSALMISTGGNQSGTQGSAAMITFKPKSKDSKVKVVYSIVTQEYCKWVSSFNDTIGIGFVGAPNLEITETVEKANFEVTTDSDLFSGDPDYGTLSNNSADAYGGGGSSGSKCGFNNPKTNWSGVTGKSAPRVGGFAEKSFSIPESVVDGNGNVTLAFAVADAGDNYYDTALIIHSVTEE